MQAIPANRLIGVNNGAWGHVLADKEGAIGLFGHHGYQGATTTLTGNHNRLALCGNLKAAILTVGLVVLLANVAANVRAVDFDFAGKLALVLRRPQPHAIYGTK